MWKKEQLTALAILFTATAGAASQPGLAVPADSIQVETLCAEINQFLSQQLAAHVRAITSLDPAPDRVLGAGTTGEYTWGTFMRSIGAYAEMSGQRSIGWGGRPAFAGQDGLSGL